MKLNLTARGTGYGYSLWEFQVFGNGTTTTPPPTTHPRHRLRHHQRGAEQARHLVVRPDRQRPRRRERVRRQRRHPLGQRLDRRRVAQVDLGSSQSVCRVELDWEAAYGKSFTIQASDSSTSGFTTIGTVTNGTGGKQSSPRPARAATSASSAPPAAPATATRSGRSACSQVPDRRPPTRRPPHASGPTVPHADATNPRLRPEHLRVHAEHPGRRRAEQGQRGLRPAGVQPVRHRARPVPVRARHVQPAGQHRLLHLDQRRRAQPRRRADQRRRLGRRAVVQRQRDAELLAVRGELRRDAEHRPGPLGRRQARRSVGSTSRATSRSTRRPTAGRPAATSPTRRSTARSCPTRSSSGTPATRGSASGPARCGTRCSPASRTRRRRRFPSPAVTTVPHHGRHPREAVPLQGERQVVGVRPEPAQRHHRHHVGERLHGRHVARPGHVLPGQARRLRARRSTWRSRRA